MIKWTKPSGVVVETNEDEYNIEAAENLGWKREGEKPKRTRRTPAQMAAAKEKENGDSGTSGDGIPSEDSSSSE